MKLKATMSFEQFKALFTPANIAPEVRVLVRPDNVEIICLDPAHSQLASARASKDAFSTFDVEVDGEAIVDIDSEKLLEFMTSKAKKFLDDDSPLDILVDGTQGTFAVRHPKVVYDGRFVTASNRELTNVKDYDLVFEYPVEFVLPSKDLKDACEVIVALAGDDKKTAPITFHVRDGVVEIRAGADWSTGECALRFEGAKGELVEPCVFALDYLQKIAEVFEKETVIYRLKYDATEARGWPLVARCEKNGVHVKVVTAPRIG